MAESEPVASEIANTKIVKRYDQLAAGIDTAAKTCAEEVTARTFPTADQTDGPKNS